MNTLRLLAVGLLASLVIMSPLAASAATQSAASATTTLGQAAAPNSAGNVGQGLEISPPLLTLNADPGQTITTGIRLRNVTQAAVVTKAETNDFAAKDEQGDPKIILDPSETSTFSLRNWIAPVADLQLAPGEVKTATVTIHVPPNAEPGGHYGVVRFTALPPDLQGQTGVALSASIGTLILLKVNGQTTEKLSFAGFFVSQNGHQRRWFSAGPLTLTERIQNQGNVHEQPTGRVEITNLFGHKIASLQVNPQQRNVLPASIRRFDQILNRRWLIGRFRARVNLTYAADHRALASQSIVFWVIPLKLITLVLIGLLLIIGLVWWSLKRYKARVLRQARVSHRQ